MTRSRLTLFSCLLVGLLSLGSCKPSDPGAASVTWTKRSLPTGVGGVLLSELSTNLTAAGYSQGTVNNTLDGAASALAAESLSESDDLITVAPVVQKGAQTSLSEADSGVASSSGRMTAINQILGSITVSLKGRATVSAKLGKAQFAVTGSYSDVIEALTEAAIINLTASGIDGADLLGGPASLVDQVTSRLSEAGVPEASLGAVTQAMATKAVAALDNAGISAAAMGAVVEGMTSAMMDGLKRSGVSTTTLSAVTMNVSKGAVSGLKGAGVSDDDMATFATKATNGVMTGMKSAGFDAAAISNKAADITQGAVEGLAAAGVSTTKVAALTTQIQTGIKAGLKSKGGATDAQVASVETAITTASDKGVSAFGASAPTLPGFDISAISGKTNESGTSATFTIKLKSKPTGNVTLAVSSNNTAEGSVSPATLTFTDTNWNAKQTVTVTGVNDTVVDGDISFLIVLAKAVSTDTLYSGKNPADVAVINADNDTATSVATVKSTVSISTISGQTSEAGATATIQVVLDAIPSGDVTIPVTSNNTSEATVDKSSLIFTKFNWSTAQTVRITGVDDPYQDGAQNFTIQFGAITSSDVSYNGVNPTDVSGVNQDNDTAGATVTTGSLTTTEAGGQTTFTVALNSRPTGNVTFSLASTDTTEATVSPASLTFTGLNYAAAQTVTVSGVDDFVADGNQTYKITIGAASSSDTNYNNVVNPTDLSLSNTDNETAGYTISAISGNTTELGAGTGTFTVKLNSQPTANVVIPVVSLDTTEGTVGPASLTFTSVNWSSPQTVTVTGVDDSIADGNISYTVQLGQPSGSGDATYAAMNPADVTATNTDNETVGFTLTNSGTTTEAGGTATVSLKLNSNPGSNVTVSVTSSDTTEGTVLPASLTFTSLNWASAQNITVTGVDDAIADGNQLYYVVLGVASSSSNYNGYSPQQQQLSNTDNETPGFTLSAISSSTSEAGGQAQMTIRLNNKPSSNVTVGVTSSDLTEGTLTLPGGGSTLTFTPANWNANQTIIANGVDDSVADGNQNYNIVFGAASSSSPYNGKTPAAVTVSNVDNETAGFTFGASINQTTEAGGTGGVYIKLTSNPGANVTFSVTSSDLTEGTVSPSSLLFTSTDWNSTHTVTVTGVDDLVADGNQSYNITLGAATSTSAYNGLTPTQQTFTNVDNETPGFTFTNSGTTTEAGGTATIGVKLNANPGANVSFSVTSSDTTEGTVLPASLTFTNANWSAVQNLTVTGVDDSLADGNQSYQVTFGAATSTSSYSGMVPTAQTLSNTDNETPGFTFGAISGATTEAGGTATFTVKLNNQPTADVSIIPASLDSTEGTVTSAGTAGTMTFTSVNWNTPQTVTVTGVDDLVADGNISYIVQFSPATSAGVYNGVTPASQTLSNTDNDTAGHTFTAITGATTEAGGTATFTVKLNSQPLGNVNMALSTSDATEGTVSPASLTFTTANYNVAQTVTVTGVDDALVDGNVAYSIVTGASTTGEASYAGVNPADVAVTNNDNEVLKITSFVIESVQNPAVMGGTNVTGYIDHVNHKIYVPDGGMYSTGSVKATVTSNSGTLTPASLTSVNYGAGGATITVSQTGITSQVYTVSMVRPVKVPDTAQTTCYNATAALGSCPTAGSTNAQDGSYNTTNQQNITVNQGAGTVLDSVTGLTWALNPGAATMNWSQSVSSCASLNTAGLGGFNDWRLPEAWELGQFLAIEGATPYLATGVVGTATAFWSNTSLASNTALAMKVDTASGLTYNGGKTFSAYYRCVRGTKAAVGQWIDNGDQTVTDAATGLIWDQRETTTKTWGNALTYCETLNHGGATNWRVPNRNELETLLDYTKATTPHLNTTFFASGVADKYWTSTTAPHAPTTAIVVDFANALNTFTKTTATYVRCVH